MAAIVLGRIFLGLIFIASGIGKIFDWSGTSAYMDAKCMPLVPVFLVLAILLELAGGLSVATGYRQKWGAIALILFLVPATLIFHAFWSYPDEEQKIQMIMFMKNLSILGGLLLLIAVDAQQQTRLQLDVNRVTNRYVQ